MCYMIIFNFDHITYISICQYGGSCNLYIILPYRVDVFIVYSIGYFFKVRFTNFLFEINIPELSAGT